jgi:hypothetical protein
VPSALFALEGDRAAHLLDQAFGQRQTEPGALGLDPPLVEALEDAEDAGARLGRDADARVGHRDERVGTVQQHAQVHGPAGRRELHGIRHEVEEHLANARGVDQESFGRLALYLEGDALGRCGRACRGEHRLEQRVEGDDLGTELELPRLDL